MARQDTLRWGHQPLMMKECQTVFCDSTEAIPYQRSQIRSLQSKGLVPSSLQQNVGKLAYQLELPLNWKIYSVVPIVQLEPAPQERDYGIVLAGSSWLRPRVIHQKHNHMKFKHLLRKRIRKHKGDHEYTS